jgi:O-antigen/teichoic acid export membrane protein
MKALSIGALNIVLRGITMSARLVLLVSMARHLEPEQLGVFALFTSANLWGLYLQGLEFHLFSARSLVGELPAVWARGRRDAFALYGTVFIAAALVWTVVFSGGFLPWTLLPLFLLILALEHVAQESYRLLNMFERPLAGSVVLFARSGAWMYVVALLLWQSPSARTLELVFGSWAAGAGISALLALWFLRDLPWRGLGAIDWSWLKRGLAVCMPLLVGSLAFRGIALFERYWLGRVDGESTLGVFGFYATIAGALSVLAESGIGNVLYPRMLKAWKSGQLDEYRAARRRLWTAFAVFLMLAIPASWFALWLIVDHLGHPEYAVNLDAYIVLLGAAALSVAGSAAQYDLWTRGRDRTMIMASVGGLVVALVLGVVLIPRHGLLGAAWCDLGAAGAMLVLRGGAVIALRGTPAVGSGS